MALVVGLPVVRSGIARAPSTFTLKLEGVGARSGWGRKAIDIVVRVVPMFFQKRVDIPRDVGESLTFRSGGRGGREGGGLWGLDFNGQVLASNHCELICRL